MRSAHEEEMAHAECSRINAAMQDLEMRAERAERELAAQVRRLARLRLANEDTARADAVALGDWLEDQDAREREEAIEP